VAPGLAAYLLNAVKRLAAAMGVGRFVVVFVMKLGLDFGYTDKMGWIFQLSAAETLRAP